MKTLTERDLQHIWHPGSKMKNFEQYPPIIIEKAQGSYLYTPEGPIIDAISSWWCKSLGHGHPEVIEAIQTQLHRFEHVIGANTTHPPLIELGELLAEVTGNQHVFFASDGATAVEIAMKLSLAAHQIKGQSERREFVHLKNSYHGESIATMSVTDLGHFTHAYQGLGVKAHCLDTIPYCLDDTSPLWHDASSYWTEAETKLLSIKDNLAAIIVEPIVQGSAGMKCYSPDFLNRLAKFAKAHDIDFIADEIMTGLCRTGAWLASNHANIQPNLICLSKGLTSGTMPLSAVMIDSQLYNLFYHEKTFPFLHSNTFSGHALGIVAALATLRVMQQESMVLKANVLGRTMRHYLTEIQHKTGLIKDVRGVGAIAACTLTIPPTLLAQEALSRGALLRPIGDTLYWLPPLNMPSEVLEQLAEITLNSLLALNLPSTKDKL